MYYTARTSELETPLAVLYPVNLVPGQYTSVWVNMETYHRAHLELLVGVMGQTATIDCMILQATDAAGTNMAPIASKGFVGLKAITMLAQAAGDGNDICRIELQTEEMGVDNHYTHIAVLLTVANAPCQVAYALYGNEPRYPPLVATAFTEVID